MITELVLFTELVLITEHPFTNHSVIVRDEDDHAASSVPGDGHDQKPQPWSGDVMIKVNGDRAVIVSERFAVMIIEPVPADGSGLTGSSGADSPLVRSITTRSSVSRRST